MRTKPYFLELILAFFVSALCLLPANTPQASAQTNAPTLDSGFRQMYNLQFQDAHKTFHDYEERNPGDPMGMSSDAAAYLFSEFDRLGVLQAELFVNDEKYKKRPKLAPDPTSKRDFEAAIAASELQADRALMASPKDSNALLAKVLNRGLRGDYTALVEKRKAASVGYLKDAGKVAEQLLALDPNCYDAYLALGVENYILGLKSAPVRWALHLYGAETNKQEGIEKLQLTADKGHYLLPFARLLLAVAALRDKESARAKELLGGLAREFPQNKLYATELAKLQ